MSRVKSELYFSEMSIATGDPSRGGTVKPLLELLPFSIFFQWCCVTESQIKMESFSALIRTYF